MQHVGRMDVLEPTESLIEERLEVGVRERLGGSDLEVRMYDGLKVWFQGRKRRESARDTSRVGREVKKRVGDVR